MKGLINLLSFTDPMEDKKQEALYSRQIFTIGVEAMKKIATSSCLISGMNGAGIEIAKNAVLSGVKIVTIHDLENTKIEDLSSQFYLTEADVGKNRATASLPKLAELNEYVQVEALTTPITEELIAKYKVVVLVNQPEDEIIRISQLCRQNHVKFILADIAGLFSRIFVDVGPEHVVSDRTGERIKMYALGNVFRGERTLIDLVDGEAHDLTDDDYVSFSLVEGMTQLNDLKPCKVIRKNRTSFYIDVNSTSFPEYTKNGYITEVRMPFVVKHEDYQTQLKHPDMVENGDLINMLRPYTIHSCFLALDQYKKKNGGAFPKPHDEKDAAAFVALAKAQHTSLFPDAEAYPFDETCATLFARVCAGNTAAVTSGLGGIVGQEVMKAVTNRLVPMSQWLYLDHSQCLDKEHLPTAADAAPTHSRYDGQVAIIGKALQERLLNLRVFLVGAGAIGCEALKNFALMGVACGPKGEITVTDMDNIELSNLSRQFLFRQKDVQKPKSVVAGAAVAKINPGIHIRALTTRVGQDTESIFDTDFWNSLDVVANALDNVPSRLYVDDQCVRYCKPLFECGTLGTKGNTQSIIPHLTENYGASADPPEADLPMCTVRNLPDMIEHTIEYARGLFVELFTEQLADASSYLRDSKAYLERLRINPANRMATISNLLTNLVTDRPKTFDDCVVWARKLFEQTFSNQIKQLLFNFPPNATSPGGIPFWSGKHRLPTPIAFDQTNPLHCQFVGDAAFIRATAFGIAVDTNIDYKKVGEVAGKVTVAPFVPKKGMKIEFNEGESGEASSSSSAAAAASSSAAPDAQSSSLKEVEEEIEKEREAEDKEFLAFTSKIPLSTSPELSSVKVSSVDFEKDDDSNHHIDFITACANLRAINYSIPTADRSKVKLISGKIIPAIATTTGLVSGLTMFDLLTYARGAKNIEAYRNWFVNLAINTYTFMEPMPAPKLTGTNFTIWDQVVFDYSSAEQPTLQGFLDRLKKERGWTVTMLCFGAAMLFMDPSFDPKQSSRLGMRLTDAIEDLTHTKLAEDTKELLFVIGADNPDDPDEQLDLPSVTVRIAPLKH